MERLLREYNKFKIRKSPLTDITKEVRRIISFLHEQGQPCELNDAILFYHTTKKGTPRTKAPLKVAPKDLKISK